MGWATILHGIRVVAVQGRVAIRVNGDRQRICAIVIGRGIAVGGGGVGMERAPAGGHVRRVLIFPLCRGGTMHKHQREEEQGVFQGSRS